MHVARGVVAFVVVMGLLACSGVRLPVIGGRWNNVEACRAYVAAYNALECVSDSDAHSPRDNCPSSLDEVPCDLSEHYACMIPRTVCVDGRPDVSAHLECGDRSCN